MATYIEAKIFEALATKLAALTLSPTMQVAWPNVDFTPPASGYLRATHLPADTRQASLGDAGLNRHIGIFQVDVFLAEGGGETAVKDIAGAVIAHFKRGTVLTTGGIVLKVNEPPTLGPVLKASPYIQAPVTIRYMVDAANPS